MDQITRLGAGLWLLTGAAACATAASPPAERAPTLDHRLASRSCFLGPRRGTAARDRPD